MLSCKTKQNVGSEKVETEISTDQTGITNKEYPDMNVKAEIGDTKIESSSVQILKSSIDGNLLTLKIGYSGGCAEHSFEFIGSEMIAKSLPPIRNVRLIHYANGETCRIYIERKLVIDLRELAYEKKSGSQIKLNISGQKDQQILYTYQD
tara:strand:+ start:186 stop:635 length:450 start_codon:yes stop_codon:yes gene_type:complete